jgi:uncharacterized protein (DUF2267 family)
VAAERKTESKLTEATAKTTAVLQTLQARLNREPAAVREETPEDLGKQLQDYFASAGPTLVRPKVPEDHIRETVIEGVVERILSSWEDSHGQLTAEMKHEVVSRLIERVLAKLRKGEI